MGGGWDNYSFRHAFGVETMWTSSGQLGVLVVLGSIGFSMFSVCGVGEGAVLSVYCQYVGVFRGIFWRIWGGCGDSGGRWGWGGSGSVGGGVWEVLGKLCWVCDELKNVVYLRSLK